SSSEYLSEIVAVGKHVRTVDIIIVEERCGRDIVPDPLCVHRVEQAFPHRDLGLELFPCPAPFCRDRIVNLRSAGIAGAVMDRVVLKDIVDPEVPRRRIDPGNLNDFLDPAHPLCPPVDERLDADNVNAWTILRGTLRGSLSSRWMAASMLPACMVENVVWPVFIAWKSVCASGPRTSPTMMYSGRCLMAARRRSNILMALPPSVSASRVTLAIQLS